MQIVLSYLANDFDRLMKSVRGIISYSIDWEKMKLVPTKWTIQES